MSGELTGRSDTAAQPTSFAELNGGAKGGVGCRRCGEPATHRVQMVVRPLGGGPGTPRADANHKSELCERCAVQLFAATRKAMR